MGTLRDSPWRRVARTALQLIASGILTGAVSEIAHGLNPGQAATVLAGWQVVVTFAQNLIEDKTGTAIFGTKETL